ncbi:MAG: hypothetical protein GY909_18785 [Oligoflexia bacterium]|nr:hypothetical protein [Oligoflexia bacterium]
MKWLISTITLVFLVSCQPQTDKCLVKKAAFDVGSGSTKVTVAEVNICTKKISKILHEDQAPVAYKDNLIKNDNSMTRDIIQQGTLVLLAQKSKARKLGATEFNGVATSAFRKAKNGIESLKKLSEKTEINLSIISQNEEARLGVLAVEAQQNFQGPYMVWDIGGGSSQITLNNSGKVNEYLGNIASVTFKDMAMKIGNRRGLSPNPIGKSLYENAKKELKERIIKDLPIAFRPVPKNTKVIGIGGVHYYSVKGQTKSRGHFTLERIKKVIPKRYKLTDKQIGGRFAPTDVTNLILVESFMEVMGIEEVYPMKINMGYGILIR